MPKTHFRELLVGLTLGVLGNEAWQRHHLRAFSSAVERGDYDEAQRQLRRFYYSDIYRKLRRPPIESDSDDEDGDGSV